MPVLNPFFHLNPSLFIYPRVTDDFSECRSSVLFTRVCACVAWSSHVVPRDGHAPNTGRPWPRRSRSQARASPLSVSRAEPWRCGASHHTDDQGGTRNAWRQGSECKNVIGRTCTSNAARSTQAVGIALPCNGPRHPLARYAFRLAHVSLRRTSFSSRSNLPLFHRDVLLAHTPLPIRDLLSLTPRTESIRKSCPCWLLTGLKIYL